MTDQELQQQYGGLATSNAPTVTAPAASQPQASQVYSTANVQQTLTNPASAPDYSDPYKLRDYFYNSPDVVSARNDVKALTDKLNAFETSQQNQQNYLENQTVAMPVITGEQANQARLGAATRESLSRELLAKQSYLDTATNEANAKYQIAQEQRGQLQSLIAATNGKAGISYADSYETALKKADKYATKQAEEQAKEARKQAEKDMLRQAYFQEFGKLPKKGMSTKEISKKLGKSTAEKKAFQEQLDQLELQTKQTALASAKQSLANSSKTSSQDELKSSLTEAIYSGKYNREAAKSIYEQTTGKSGDWVYTAAPDNYEQNITKSGSSLTLNQQANLEASLSKSYQTNTNAARTAIQNANIVNTAYTEAINNLNSGKSIGAQSQAIVTAFNKILDPASVVRESEYARTPEGQSLINRMEGYATKLAQGGAGLSASELANIRDTANALSSGYQKYIENETNRIQNQVNTYGLNIGNIVPQGQSSSSQNDPLGIRY